MLGFDDSDCHGNVRALARRDFLLRWMRRLGCIAVLLALSFGGYRGYRAIREKHLASQAQEFLAQQDYASAFLVTRRVLQLNQNNVAACRVMAELAEAAGRLEAMSWRQRVATLEPDVPENLIARAATALRFGQIDLAGKVLDGVGPTARTGVKYHQIAGALALAQKQPDVAESHFNTALKLEPNNLQLALNLASVQLASPTKTTNDRGRATLVQLSEQPPIRVEALRALAADALTHDAPALAEQWTTKLKAEKNATFSDELLYLEATHGSAAASGALLEAQAKAAQSTATVASLINWMNRHALAKSALEWAFSLSSETLNAPSVALAIAESYSSLQDWKALQSWVEGKNWGDHEYFRFAVQSHALYHLGPADRSSMESETAWHAAVKATQMRPERLAAIARLAEGWNYATKADEAWWTIANGNQSAAEALEALQRLYKSRQNSRGLLRVAKRAFELNPADLVAANNCASLGLLLTGDNSSRRLAAKLHAENPANAIFSSTYAFALHLDGKTSAALKLMENLNEGQLRYPALAAYYFVMLVENGHMERAHSFLSAANKATLLPEEQQLLAAATRKLLEHDARTAAKSVALTAPPTP